MTVNLSHALRRMAGHPDDFRMPMEQREALMQAAQVIDESMSMYEVVAKLPRTRDHVAVVPAADSVWYLTDAPGRQIRRLWDWRWDPGDGVWLVADRRSTPEMMAPVSECYSSWERAMLAARRRSGEVSDQGGPDEG